MKKIFIITGASGHLGNTLVRFLHKKGYEVRGLLLPMERGMRFENVRYYKGDVCKIESLRPLFEGLEDREVYVIHTAGIVDISDRVSPGLYRVNVGGTKNIITLCREYRIKRLVYVSSVHAIPEKDRVSVLTEVSCFLPEAVKGGYAKTKAEATQAVLEAAREGLDAVIVHPSGILGPYDNSKNHLVQLVTDYLSGSLPACVEGGYDFVDVRDVAKGCLMAAARGRSGECYILSNRYYEIREVLSMVKGIAGGRRLPVLPVWAAKLAVPFIQWEARVKKKRPLYTAYALYALKSNGRFSHDKATRELGYSPRDFYQTVKDTVSWYRRREAL